MLRALQRSLSKIILPTIGESFFADQGGLIGFGPDIAAMFRRAAYYVDRLLKGDKAADLPVGNVTGFTNFESSMTGKWVGLLKDIAPQITRGRVVFSASDRCRCFSL